MSQNLHRPILDEWLDAYDLEIDLETDFTPSIGISGNWVKKNNGV